jgi:isoquinoline 1-oxidoreductase beta subunit
MPSRRGLLKAGLLAGGGLVLSFSLPNLARAAGTPADTATEFAPNAFLRINPQGIVTFISPHTEFGQGIYTSTAMLMCEELDLGLDQIQIEAAPPDLAK